MSERESPWWKPDAPAWLTGALGALAAGAVLAVIASRSPGDVDEGFYATAAELTSHGRRAYRDFFYPQAPLLPTILAPAARMGFGGYMAFRMYCVGLAAMAAGILAFAVHRETRSRSAGIAGALLMATHELGWLWLGSIRAYAPAALFGLLAFTLVSDPKRPPGWIACILAGVFAAVVPGLRLVAAPVVACVILAAALRSSTLPTWRSLALVPIAVAASVILPGPDKRVYFLAAVAVAIVLADRDIVHVARRGALALLGVAIVGGLVWWYFRRPNPAAFAYGNTGYHALRQAGGLTGSWAANRPMGYAMIGAGSAFEGSAAGAHNMVLVALGVGGIGLANGALRMPVLLAAGLLYAASLKPNGIHEHYFTLCVPYLALAAAMTLGHAAAALRGAGTRGWALPAGVCAAFLLAAAPSFHAKWVEGIFSPWNMSAFRPRDQDGALALVRQAAARHPGRILAAWEGSCLGTSLRMVEGFENHFARQAAYGQAPAARVATHTATHEDFVGLIDRRIPGVVVLDREVPEPIRLGLTAALLRGQYRKFGARIAETEVFVRDGADPRGLWR